MDELLNEIRVVYPDAEINAVLAAIPESARARFPLLSATIIARSFSSNLARRLRYLDSQSTTTSTLTFQAHHMHMPLGIL